MFLNRPLRVVHSKLFRSYTMSIPPAFKPFGLALIQLGAVGTDKSANLRHAREMIMKAAEGDGASGSRPSMIVLPVSVSSQAVSCIPISPGMLQLPLRCCPLHHLC